MGNILGFGFQMGVEIGTDQGKSYLCRTDGILLSTDSYPKGQLRLVR